MCDRPVSVFSASPQHQCTHFYTSLFRVQYGYPCDTTKSAEPRDGPGGSSHDRGLWTRGNRGRQYECLLGWRGRLEHTILWFTDPQEILLGGMSISEIQNLSFCLPVCLWLCSSPPLYVCRFSSHLLFLCLFFLLSYLLQSVCLSIRLSLLFPFISFNKFSSWLSNNFRFGKSLYNQSFIFISSFVRQHSPQIYFKTTLFLSPPPKRRGGIWYWSPSVRPSVFASVLPFVGTFVRSMTQKSLNLKTWPVGVVRKR